jgi:hypothetical protein
VVCTVLKIDSAFIFRVAINVAVKTSNLSRKSLVGNINVSSFSSYKQLIRLAKD